MGLSTDAEGGAGLAAASFRRFDSSIVRSMKPKPKPKLKAERIRMVTFTEDIARPGDCAIVASLPSTDGRTSKTERLVVKCPFCSMDMASTFQRIIRHRSWLRRLCGYPDTLSLSDMLQCPYVADHKFFIKKGRISELS